MAIDYKSLQSAIVNTKPINTDTTGKDYIGINRPAITSLEGLYYNLLVVLFWVVSIAAVLTFLYAGISYMTAGGDAEKAEKAKRIIIGSVIGMLIILASFLIFRTTVNVVGAGPNADMSDVLNQTGP